MTNSEIIELARRREELIEIRYARKPSHEELKELKDIEDKIAPYSLVKVFCSELNNKDVAISELKHTPHDEYKKAYEDLLKKNTQINAENQTLKGQMKDAVDKLMGNLKVLDSNNKKLEGGIVKALRKCRMKDISIIEWCGENNIPIALRIVPDESDEFKEN